MQDFKEDIIKDLGNIDKSKLPYKKLKGFTHIWTYFRTINGDFICSRYTREKGVCIASIRNSCEGWVIHLFYGGASFKSWFKTVPLLKDAEEYCNLFLEGKLVLDNF